MKTFFCGFAASVHDGIKHNTSVMALRNKSGYTRKVIQ